MYPCVHATNNNQIQLQLQPSIQLHKMVYKKSKKYMHGVNV